MSTKTKHYIFITFASFAYLCAYLVHLKLYFQNQTEKQLFVEKDASKRESERESKGKRFNVDLLYTCTI
jgi:hypothetical protein